MTADIHSHILCGIDDGARTLSDTKRALQGFSRAGITHLALTPHFYPTQKGLETFLSDRQRAYESLKTLPEAKDFTFSLGAEVYLTETLFNHKDLKCLCFSGTDLMLTELVTERRFSFSTEKRLLRLIQEHHVTPVLAHIDRYPFLYRNSALLFRLLKMGCLFQVNLEAFSSFFSGRRMLRLAQEGLVHFLGEDVHTTPLEGEKRQRVLSVIKGKQRDLFEKMDKAAQERIFFS